MADKQLKDKAVDIKGKKYVLVSDRVLFFNEEYPHGSIESEYTLDGETYHFRAVVTPNIETPLRRFVGHSQATIGEGMVNKTAAMENAETSAVGRALAMMGIGVIESIASVDEMHKATYNHSPSTKPRFASMKQIELMVNKVKWGRNTFDKDEIVNYLSNVLGKGLDQVLSSEVDDALQKIDAALREDKVADKVDTTMPEPDVVITDIPETIDLDKVPY